MFLSVLHHVILNNYLTPVPYVECAAFLNRLCAEEHSVLWGLF